MDSFFQEIVDFLNQCISNFETFDNLSRFRFDIVNAMKTVLTFLQSLNLAPLGLDGVLYLSLITLFFEWKNRFKGSNWFDNFGGS